MKDFQYITSQHPAFVENLYQDFVKDPESVDPELRKFFEGFDFAIASGKPVTNGNGAAVKEAPQEAAKKALPQGGFRSYKMDLILIFLYCPRSRSG